MSSLNLRDIATQFVDGQVTIEQLEDGYIPYLQSILADPYSEDADLVATIELGLIEYGDGLIDEDELRQMLGQEMQRNVAFLEFSNMEQSVGYQKKITAGISNSPVTSFGFRLFGGSLVVTWGNTD